MDLRSVLNTSNNDDGAPPGALPPTPQQQHHQHQQQHQQQHHLHRHSQGSPASYGYREYPQQQPPHPSPAKPIAQDYPHPQQHQHPSNSYPQASPYQDPRPYQSRPQPPPLQPPSSSYHDIRSPSVGRTNSAPLVSPYRSTHTPTTTPGSSTGGYPFPPTQANQDLTSPVQRHQYPPTQQQPPYHQRRDSYSQGPGVAAHSPAPYVQQPPPQPPQPHQHPHPHPHPHPQQQTPQPPQQQQQQQQHVPQASPVVTPGGSNHPYPHQRSQSTQSTPTPTSAHREYYGPQYAQGSPILATQPPPAEYNRHPSHPPTPLGPPPPASTAVAAPRQASAPSSFAQPPSPYQQRISSIGSAHTQPSPKPAAPPPLPAHRLSNSHSTQESPISETSQRPISQHERDQSLSVSPKTRVGSIPSNPDRTPAPIAAEPEPRRALSVQSMAIDSDRAVTPAKRKLDDRGMSPRELEHKEIKPPPGEVNGGYADRIKMSASPVIARKKRVPRAQPPIWAQSANNLGKRLPNSPNFVLQKRIHSHIHAPVNGKHENIIKLENASRHASPEATRPRNESHGQVSPAESGPQDILGPWEASITGVKPYEELSKTVADFLFVHVINNPDIQEIMGRGIQFEIEAKLGTLIDKDTNHRVDRFIDSECVLNENGRVAFKSSMTEIHHKAFNDFLNHVVIQTDPRAPHGGSRVQVHYKHRREIDRFFELPPDLQNHLPGCMRSRFGRGRNVRVRVTYDQKTNEVLGAIVKARVADIDIHMPTSPMDCRVSVNLEMKWDGSVEELEQSTRQGDRQPDRVKDRLSYTQGHYQIDLTQVTHAVNGPANTQRTEKEHELEIELAAGVLLDQGRRAMSGGPHRYQELVEGFIDNVRVLARKARDFTTKV